MCLFSHIIKRRSVVKDTFTLPSRIESAYLHLNIMFLFLYQDQRWLNKKHNEDQRITCFKEPLKLINYIISSLLYSEDKATLFLLSIINITDLFSPYEIIRKKMTEYRWNFVKYSKTKYVELSKFLLLIRFQFP